MLYGDLPVALATGALLAALAAAIQWPIVGAAAAGGWLLATGAVLAYRTGLLLRYRRRDEPRTASLSLFRIGVLAAGLVWGGAAIVLFPASVPAHQVFLAFVIGGLCAGASVSLAADRVSALALIVPALLPLSLRFVIVGTPLALSMAVMVALFLVFLYLVTARAQRDLEMTTRLRAENQARESALRHAQRLNAIVARAQARLIRSTRPRETFEFLLAEILSITDSEYGAIAEVGDAAAGPTGLRILAPAMTAGEEAGALSAFGALPERALVTGEAVLSAPPADDSRARSGGYGALAVIPVHHGGRITALLGLAARPGGYDPDLVDSLHPLLVTIDQLLDTTGVQRENRAARAEVDRLSQIARDTPNSVVMTDPQGRVEWVNAGFTRITGYALEEVYGRRPHTFLHGASTDPAVVRAMKRALRDGEPFIGEFVNYRKNGEPYWSRVSCHPLRDGNGELEGHMSIESDISREKDDHERLRASEQRLHTVIDSADLGTWEWNVQTGEAVFNARWAAIAGYALDELEPISIETWQRLAHPDDLAASSEALERHFSGASARYEFESRMRHKDGHWVWVSDRGRVVSRTADGKPLLMLGIHQDVTERRRAEETVRESEAHLRRVLDGLFSFVAVLSPDGTLTQVNRAPLEATGVEAAAVIGKKLWETHWFNYTDDIRQRVRQACERAAEGTISHFDVIVRNADDSTMPIEFMLAPLRDSSGRITHFIASSVDISEREAAEQDLRRLNTELEDRIEQRTAQLAASERFTRLVLDALDARLAVLDDSGRVLSTNAAWREFSADADVAWQRTTENGNYLEACTRAPEDQAPSAHEIAAGLARVIDGGQETFVHEYTSPSGAGHRWFLCRIMCFSVNTDRRVLVAHYDVTAVHDALERAAVSERAVASLGEVATIGIAYLDAEGECIGGNPTFHAMSGLPPAAVLGSGWQQALHPEDRERVASAWSGAMENGEPFHEEYRFRHADGSIVWVIGQAAEIVAADGARAGFVGTLTDITQHKQAEAAMRIVSTELIANEGQIYYQQAALRLAENVNADIAFVSRFDTATPDVLHTIACVEGGAVVPNFGYSLEGTPCKEVIAGERCIVARDVQARFPDDVYFSRKGIDAYAAQPLIDTEGQILGHIGVMACRPFTDTASVARSLDIFGLAVTAAMVRDRGRRQYRELFEFAPEAIVMSDETGIIRLVNREAELLFGRSRDELVGHSIDEILPDLRASTRTEPRQSPPGAELMPAPNVAVRAVRADGSSFPVDVSVNTVETDSGRMFATAVRDISERVRLEAERQARAVAEEANAAKSAFLASMSHELRTPLNAIIGYSEMLGEDANERGDPEAQADLERIRGAGRHLLALINDVLDLSKVEAGRLEVSREPFRLDQIVTEAADQVRPTIEKNRNALEIDIQPGIGEMTGDATRVRQILLNLLSNAAKFTEKGTVRITVAERPRDGEVWAVFTVADSGVGMTDEQLAMLYEPFHQGSAEFTRRYGGTGLGLALSRRLCHLLGGDIEVESTSGQGSSFTVSLPTHRQLQDAAEAFDDSQDGVPLVIVIDDEAQARDLLKRQIELQGYRVITAADGRTGLDLVRRLSPALVTLDIRMPQVDGWAVLRDLKSGETTRDIPVVICTVVDDAERAFALGATDYIVKPLDRDAVERIVWRYRCDDPPCTALIIANDDASREVLAQELRRAGWEAENATRSDAALASLRQSKPRLVILDMAVQTMDGFEFLRMLRGEPEWQELEVAVIVGDAMSLADRAKLDDYVQKIAIRAHEAGAPLSNLEASRLVAQVLERERRSGRLRRDSRRPRHASGPAASGSTAPHRDQDGGGNAAPATHATRRSGKDRRGA